MKISDHFDVREFVDPVTYEELGDKASELIEKKIVDCCELLREIIGRPVIVNNYHMGGQYKESGLRRLDSPTGAKKSAHKSGLAADVKVIGMKASDIRNIIRNNWPKFKEAGLTRMEKGTPTWTHIDCKPTGLDYLVEFNP